MSRLVFGLAALAFADPASLAAQGKAEHAAFVVTLGTDTIAVERFSRTATRLEGHIIGRVPRARISHYIVTLGPTGAVSRMEMTQRPLVAPGTAAPQQSAVVVFQRDSATVELKLVDSTRINRVAARPGSFPLLNSSFALYEQATRQLRKAGKDSMEVDQVLPGARQSSTTSVVRRGADSATIGFFGLPILLRVDQTGRILGADGRETTMKVKVQRLKDVNLDAIGQRFAEAETKGGALGQLSPRDTVRVAVGAANLTVDYGRPLRRGRTIFGNVVPWNQVWRTGANAATQFSTDRDLELGGQTIPAGQYTLWTLPTPDGAKLIVNRQTGQWGTDYDQSKDLARFEMKTEVLEQPVDQFTIALEPQGSGGLMKLSWDRTAWTIPFVVR